MPVKHHEGSVRFRESGDGIKQRRYEEGGVRGYYTEDIKYFFYVAARFKPDEAAVLKEIGEKIEKERVVTKDDVWEIFKKHMEDTPASRARMNRILLSLTGDNVLLWGIIKKKETPLELFRKVTHTKSTEKQRTIEHIGSDEAEAKTRNLARFINSLVERNKTPSREELLEFIRSNRMTEYEFNTAVGAASDGMKKSNTAVGIRLLDWKKKLKQAQFQEEGHQTMLNRFIADDEYLIAENKKKIEKANELLGILSTGKDSA